MIQYRSYYQSPVGSIEIRVNDRAVEALSFVSEVEASDAHPLLTVVEDQLKAYFEKRLQRFDLPLQAQGTDFQRRVWQVLSEVPYGQTTTYGDLARDIGNPRAARAVGMANNRNPISIIVPCHRVIGSNGQLVGYGAGIQKKEWLLKHEGVAL